MTRAPLFVRLSGRGNLPYGWWVAAALFIMRTVSNGVSLLSFGLFVTPLTDSFSWSRTELNAATSFGLVQMITTPVAGRLMDRFGARVLMLYCIPVVAAGYFLRSGINNLWQFYATQVIIVIGNTALTDMPVAVVLSNWYQRKRGRMVGAAMMGANFGGLAVTPLIAWMITMWGWRAAYAGIGVLVVAVIAPVVWFLVWDRPEQVGLLPDDGGVILFTNPTKQHVAGMSAGEALRTPTYWICAVVFVFSSLTFASVLQQVVPHLENVGMGRDTATWTIGAVSLFGMGGKLAIGWLTDRMPARFAMMLALAFEVVGLFCLTLVQVSQGFLLPFIPLYGTGYASMGAVQPLLTAETFGLRSFASIQSGFQVFTAPAVALSTPAVGAVFDRYHSYNPAFLSIAAGFAFAAILLLFVRPRPESNLVKSPSL